MIWSILLYLVLVIFGILILLIAWILIMPFYLQVDTENGRYRTGLRGLLKVIFLPEEAAFELQWPLYHHKIHPRFGDEPKPKKKKAQKLQKKSSKFPLSFKQSLKLARELIQTFKVRRFNMNLDTGDYTTNAQLVPVMWLLSGETAHFSTNYVGISSLDLLLENRLIRIVGPVLKYLVFKRK